MSTIRIVSSLGSVPIWGNGLPWVSKLSLRRRSRVEGGRARQDSSEGRTWSCPSRRRTAHRRIKSFTRKSSMRVSSGKKGRGIPRRVHVFSKRVKNTAGRTRFSELAEGARTPPGAHRHRNFLNFSIRLCKST